VAFQLLSGVLSLILEEIHVLVVWGYMQNIELEGSTLEQYGRQTGGGTS
jgi:hypothetical protein